MQPVRIRNPATLQSTLDANPSRTNKPVSQLASNRPTHQPTA